MIQKSERITRRDALGLFAAGSTALLATGVEAFAQEETRQGRRPNIVLIFADDLGYGDLGCYGSETIRTPNLDRMAAEGTLFTDFYSCAPVCTPSRAGLLTGRYPIRSGLTRVLFPFSKDGIGNSEITLAELLKEQGYATACIGKWHLGHLPPHLPTEHGFDFYYGIPYSNDMNNQERGDPPIPLMRDTEIIEQPAHQSTLTKRYTDESLAFIRANQERPFFLYLPHTMPHVPIYASPEFDGRSGHGLYTDVIEEIDWSVGRILGEIRRLGLDDNTLVIFTSDNGPWLVKKEDGGSSGELRHGKGTTFDGGVKIPCIARWPGQIQQGLVQENPAIMLDWLPTLTLLAGGTVPQDRAIDGRDIRGMLTNEGMARPDEEFFFYNGRRLEAMRWGDWKLKRPFQGKVYGESLEHDVLLFNLKDDPGENTNLAEQFPHIVDNLHNRMKMFEQSLGDVPEEKK